MGKMEVSSGVKSATLEAILTRADGTVVNLGVISRYESDPRKRLAYRIRDFLKRKRIHNTGDK